MPVRLSNPLNRSHPLFNGLAMRLIALPGRVGGLTFYDLAKSNHGALTSMANTSNGWRQTTRPGGFAQVLCDGSAGYINCGSHASLDSTTFTVGCWFTTSNAAAAFGTILARDISASFLWGLRFNSTNSVLSVYLHDAGVPFVASSTVISNNVWYHVTLRYDASTVKIYLNGVEDCSVGTSGAINSTTGIPLTVMARGDAALLTPGSVDDVFYATRAWSAAEILQNYRLSQLGYPGLLNRYKPRGCRVSGLLSLRRRIAA